jgi:isocitrate lyase
MYGRNDNLFDNLSIYTAILQVLTVVLATNDATNNDLMQELHTQDSKYLQKIIEQNEKIIKMLEKSNKTDSPMG